MHDPIKQSGINFCIDVPQHLLKTASIYHPPQTVIEDIEKMAGEMWELTEKLFQAGR